MFGALNKTEFSLACGTPKALLNPPPSAQDLAFLADLRKPRRGNRAAEVKLRYEVHKSFRRRLENLRHGMPSVAPQCSAGNGGFWARNSKGHKHMWMHKPVAAHA